MSYKKICYKYNDVFIYVIIYISHTFLDNFSVCYQFLRNLLYFLWRAITKSFSSSSSSSTCSISSLKALKFDWVFDYWFSKFSSEIGIYVGFGDPKSLNIIYSGASNFCFD